MTAEILSVGTELLLGDIVNTNAAFLSKELAKLGINVYVETTVGDNAARLLDAYRSAFARADLVITTGGLGPTEDDLTKEVAASYFNLPLVEHTESMRLLRGYFDKPGVRMTSNNLKQAFIPEGATVLPNANGTAPGCMVEQNGKILVMLPGPPNECVPMYHAEVVPRLKPYSDSMFISKTLRLVGIGESALETDIKDMLDAQTNPTIAPYAKTGECTLRITAKAADEAEAARLIAPVRDELYRRFGTLIYGEDDTTLAETLVRLLTEKGVTLACAESCTGGLLTSAVADVPGASAVLIEGAVTYANDAKMRRLGVREETLARHGAVSRETAAEMAAGIARTAGADVGVSTTGIAGPDGGTPDKPVGLVYIGLFFKGETEVVELRLSGNRRKIRERTVIAVLDMVRKEVLCAGEDA